MIVDKEKLKTEEKDSSEPKAGDMVEAAYVESFCDHWEGMFTGGKSKHGLYIVETNNTFEAYNFIRLPQKSEVESKARELIKDIDFGDEWLNEKAFEYGINCIKWGQQNPTKI